MEIKPMQLRHPGILTILVALLTLCLAIASYYGAFVETTYERDSLSMAAQGMGQDMFDLFFVAPLLVISLIFSLQRSRLALLILGGTLFYILYSFFIYAFGVHFNSLFLLYCLILGLSLYAFLLFFQELNGMNITQWFNDTVPTRSIGPYFIVIAILFYMLWLKDVLPAVIAGTVPASVSDNRLLVNPVHVLDIAIALPGLIITALLLFRRHTLGFIFAPVFLVFTILLALALVAMVVALNAKGISEDMTTAAIFILLAAISMFFLVRLAGSMRRSSP